MKTLILSIFVTILGLGGVSALAQDDESEFPDVETLMTPEDFEASGLEKLSEAERAHLSEWLERYREGAVKGPKVNKPPSQWTEEEREAEASFEIMAKVIPGLRGWNGKTVFRLDNGQTWQQRMPGKFRYTGENSEVVITKNMVGGYKMKHVESGRTVLVKRVD